MSWPTDGPLWPRLSCVLLHLWFTTRGGLLYTGTLVHNRHIIKITSAFVCFFEESMNVMFKFCCRFRENVYLLGLGKLGLGLVVYCFTLILKGFSHRMSTFISEIIFCIVFSYTYFTSITIAVSDSILLFPNLWCLFEFDYTCSNCWLAIVQRNCLFTIPKSVVFRKFHIQPTLSESIKLTQDHLV